MSAFDSLLDFGDPSPTDKDNVNKPVSDPFDPFGSSQPMDMKSNSGTDLLGGITFDTQLNGTQNSTTNGHTLSLNSSSDLNPLYALSMSSNIMADSNSVNPLYELNNAPDTQKQEILMQSSGSTNPVYDFLSTEGTNGHSDDLLGLETNASVSVETTNQDGGNLLFDIDSNQGNVNYQTEVNGSNGVILDEFDSLNKNGLNQDLVSTEQDNDSIAIEDLEKPDEVVSSQTEVISESEAIEELDQQGESEAKDPQTIDEQVLIDTIQQDTPEMDVPTTRLLAEDVVQQESSTEVDQTDLLGGAVEVQTQYVVEDNAQLDQEDAKEPEESKEDVLEESREDMQEDVRQDVKEDYSSQEDQNLYTEEESHLEEKTKVEEVVKEEVQEEESTPQEQIIQDEGEPRSATPVKEVLESKDDVPEPSDNSTVAEDITEAPQQNSDPIQTDELIVPLVDEISITRSPSSSEGEQEEERGPKGEKTTTTKKQETKTEETSSGKKTTVVTTTTKTTTVVQNGDISNGPHDSRENEETDVRSSTQKPTVQEEIMSVEGGVYENEPVREPGVARESDKNIGEELPEVGMAKNILQKFTQIQEEAAKPVVGKRGATPPRGTGPVEYVSEPRTVIEKPEQKIEGGIFENQPSVEEGVVKSYEVIEDVKPEQGYARNVLAKFKEIESKVEHMPPPSPKKELTPDRFTKGEYVSEPRTVFEKYEGKTESGIFESQPQDVGDIVKSGQHEEEVLPEQGTAKNLVSKFKQYETQAKSPPMPHQKKELTPDRNTRGEYVSEPRSTFQQYESQPESGIYESKPEDRPEIIKSGDYYEEPLPEEGYAKNVISKFKTIQEGSSPVPSPSRPREITPPRQDTFSGILESTPQERPDIVKSYEVHETSAELPESGMARNILNKFKEIQQSGSNSPVSPRHKKEFTPPPQSGVYENTPQPSIVPEQRPPESGILESSPEQREGVAREGDLSAGTVEFPERGYAKNMVSKWKQIESESKSSSPSPRYKEFTPPRDEPRISSAKSPLSPKSPAGANSSVHPRDLPGQYQEQVQPGIYENQPEFREDLAREEDTDWGQGLPKEGTSRSLINKFKHVQEDAKKAMETPPPISRRDSSDTSKTPVKKKMFEDKNGEPEGDEAQTSSIGTPKSPFVAVQLEKCAACQKTVYAMEKVEMNKNSYHRACFKCSHCNSRLTAKTFSMNEGIMYCTNHFKQLFARKGNYDEGFGRQQYKKRWQGDQGEPQTVSEPSA